MKAKTYYLLSIATAGLFVLLTLILPGCGKQNDDSDNETPPTATNCKLLKQSTNIVPASPQYFQFEYDANGNPSKITTFYNGSAKMVETVQPTLMTFKEAPDNSSHHSITYDVSYLDKQPASAGIRAYDDAQVRQVYGYAYDSKGRLATVTYRNAGDGNDNDNAIKLIFTYDDNNNVTKVTYQNSIDGVYVTLTATGYDNHSTPYSGLKNNAFLQYDFNWADAMDANSRYVFDHLSAHNLLGYQLSNVNGTVWSETFTYTYNDKGLPTQRDATLSDAAGTITKHYYDAWEYDCQ